MKNSVFAVIAAFLATPALCEGEMETGTFLCISEMSTGFKVAEGQWQHVRFKVGGQYIVRPLREAHTFFREETPLVQYAVFRFGEEAVLADAYADRGFSVAVGDETWHMGYLDAGGLGFNTFAMDNETLRFTSTYLGSWVSQNPNAAQEGGDTPSITIGSCTRL